LFKALEINPEHTTVLGMLGSLYAAKRDYGKAKETFEKAIATNYKYNFAYFILAQIEAQNNPAKALEYIELHDKHNGAVPQAWDIGIQLARQQNKGAIASYFEAKKAYLVAKDGPTAISKLQESLRQDPDYEPAVKLQEKFDELRKEG